jgi:hypothetical protein
VPTQSIVIPTKVVGVIESTPNVIPVTLPRLRVVRIRSHFRQRQNRLLVCVVRSCDLIHTPARCREWHSRSMFLRIVQHHVNGGPSSIRHALDIRRHRPRAEDIWHRLLRLRFFVRQDEWRMLRYVLVSVEFWISFRSMMVDMSERLLQRLAATFVFIQEFRHYSQIPAPLNL